MVKILIINALLHAVNCCGQAPTDLTVDHIRIDHIGPIDKPILSLIISSQKLTLPVTELAINVDADIFVLLSNYISGSNDLTKKKENNEFGVFRIKKVINHQSVELFTPAREKSVHFFNDLKIKLSGSSSPKLIAEIDRILDRIEGGRKR